MAVRNKTEFGAKNIYFITFTICEWQKVFTSQKYFDLFYKWFDYQQEKYKNKIHGYVIMPNHFHGLIYVSGKSPPLSKLIQNAKRFMAYEIVAMLTKDNNQEALEVFTQKARTKEGAKHKVFESRYDSKIMDSEKIYLEKLNYLHNNPYTKNWNLVETPEEYPHSSARNYLLGKGVYPRHLIVKTILASSLTMTAQSSSRDCAGEQKLKEPVPINSYFIAMLLLL